LAARIAAGDRAALTAWFCGQKDALYAFIFYRVGGDRDLAADITQSTFMNALEQMHCYDPQRGPMVSWLRTLSRNVIRDALARYRRGEQLQLAWDQLDETLQVAYRQIDRELLPDEVLMRDETRELVSMTMANLPVNYRDVLSAKYIDGQTLETIAATSATTVDAAKSLLRRARAAFRECFLAIAKLEISDVSAAP
jgi:RNA polymerase sigma-70 factor (ECF subfamily)